jgi:hypothetical protein
MSSLTIGRNNGLVTLEIADGCFFIAPMRALYPAMSAARLAANLRATRVFRGLLPSPDVQRTWVTGSTSPTCTHGEWINVARM